MLKFLKKISSKKIDISNTELNLSKMNKFFFYKEEISSFDALLSGIRFRDIQTQRAFFKGGPILVEAGDWTRKGKLYFLDKEMERTSIVYKNFLEEAFQAYIMNNPKLIKSLVDTGVSKITYASGGEFISRSLLTEDEAVEILTKLRTMLTSPI